MPTRIIRALMLGMLVLPAFAQGDLDQLRTMADQGNAEAQSNLGFKYADGRGVPQDNIQAYMWYNLAASNGADGAAKQRDQLAAKMSPGDLSEAQRLASEWKPKK